MKGDAAKAQVGDLVLSRQGTVAILSERKKWDAAQPLPGWWCAGRGGLADIALESNDWRLLDSDTVRRLWDLLEGERE